MAFYLNESAARKVFKDLLGNANHLLITILVGLHAVESGLIKEAPKELRAAWNPKDKIASSRRSRILTLQMALVRSTDALDAYIAYARRKPFLIRDGKLQAEIDVAGHKVLLKFFALKLHCLAGEGEEAILAALVEVMIVWRNRLVHSLADNTISSQTEQLIHTNSEWIKDQFNGMSVDRMLADFDSERPPTFKETASFIRATHQVVESLDRFLLSHLDAESYLKELIWSSAGANDSERAKQIQNVWGRDECDRPTRVFSFLQNRGLATSRREDSSAEFPDELLNAVAAMTPKELKAFVRGDSSV